MESGTVITSGALRLRKNTTKTLTTQPEILSMAKLAQMAEPLVSLLKKGKPDQEFLGLGARIAGAVWAIYIDQTKPIEERIAAAVSFSKISRAVFARDDQFMELCGIISVKEGEKDIIIDGSETEVFLKALKEKGRIADAAVLNYISELEQSN